MSNEKSPNRFAPVLARVVASCPVGFGGDKNPRKNGPS